MHVPHFVNLTWPRNEMCHAGKQWLQTHEVMLLCLPPAIHDLVVFNYHIRHFTSSLSSIYWHATHVAVSVLIFNGFSERLRVGKRAKIWSQNF